MGKKTNVADIYPLSPMQQGMLFHTLYDPASGVYVEQFVQEIRVQTDFDRETFVQAWRDVVERHAVLRTAFSWEKRERPLQIVLQRVKLPIEQLDWRDTDPAAQSERLDAWLEGDRTLGFDLAKAPLLRLTLIQAADDRLHCVWTYHHLLLDAWSARLVYQEVLAIYEALRQGRSLALPLPPPYHTYIAWLQEQDIAKAEAFWRAELQSLIRPTTIAGSKVSDDEAAAEADYSRQKLLIGARTTAAMLAFAREHRLTSNTLLQAAWALVLNRYSGESEVLFGVTVSGRPTDLEGADKMVGLFINSLPLRVTVRARDSLLPWLRRLQTKQFEIRKYEYSPLFQVQNWSEMPRGTALFESILVSENVPVEDLQSWGPQEQQREDYLFKNNYPITITTAIEPSHELALRMAYDRRRFDDAVIGRLLKHFRAALESLIVDPQQPLGRISLVEEQERAQLLAAARRPTQAAAAPAACLHELFEAQAARMPDAVAIVFDRGQGSGVRSQRDKETPYGGVARRQGLPRVATRGDKETRSQESGVRSQESEFLAPNPQSLIPDLQSAVLSPQSSVLSPQSLTYRELNERANRLAHHLRALAVGPEVFVGVYMERSPELIVALLGILKAGGAYLPIDPAYPAERLAFMMEDARAPVLITATDQRPTTNDQRPTPRRGSGQATNDGEPRTKNQEPCDDDELKTQHSKLKTQKSTPSPPHLVTLSRSWSAITLCPADNPVSTLDPANLAYMIYTSGSTGRPKGVQITHANVIRLFTMTQPWFNFDAHDVWTLFHSYAFDFSVWEIWGALLYGGKLAVVPYEVSRSPENFYELLCREQVTVLNQTPSAFDQLIRAEAEIGQRPDVRLRLVIFGGEALDLPGLRPWFARHGDHMPQLVNMYGITETTVHVTYRPLTLSDVEAAPGSLIGGSIPDLQMYVLDQEQQLLPIGVAGELYIGGAGVARGYLNRPDLTAERFIPNPFGDKETRRQGLPREGTRGDKETGDDEVSTQNLKLKTQNLRLYRTGDLARYLPDGDVEYLGRIDMQVKIRGFRIELGEIEALLAQHARVYDAVVLAREVAPGDTRLVAYVVTSDELQVTSSQNSSLVTRHPLLVTQLRDFLQARLPDYMVPSAFVMLDALPLTTNGKLDRQALPAPDTARPELHSSYVAPRTPIEEQIARVWSQVLNVEKVGIHDHFFDLGGHSVLAMRLLSLLREHFDVSISLRALFESPTVEGLATAIALQQVEQEDSEELARLLAELEQLSDAAAKQLLAG